MKAIKHLSLKPIARFSKQKLLIIMAGVAAIGICVIYLTHASAIVPVPLSIASDCSRDVDTELNNFFQTVPDGSTIQFPLNGCYKQAHRILIADRHDLTIDGNGSSFTTSSTKLTSGGGVDGNWVILRGTNITLENMTANGAFTAYDGQPRSLATISPDPNFTEASMNYGLYGVDGVHLTDVTGTHPWGDGITTGPDAYADSKTVAVWTYAKNIFIDRAHIDTTARMCFGPTSGINIWIQDSSCKNNWYGGVDAEEDGLDQPLQGLHVLNNTFDGFNTLGIFVPVASHPTTPTTDIEIRGNKFLTIADRTCSPIIRVGGYPDSNPNTFANIVVENNSLLVFASGIYFDHVQGGSIQNNTLQLVDLPGYTPAGYCGEGNASTPIVQTNSTAVTIANNSINGSTTTPPSSTPVPTPTPPLPTTSSSPAPSSSCPAPTNLNGTSGPSGSGRYDFTWSAAVGATSYNLYFAVSPGQPATLYTGPFTTLSGSAYSLNPSTLYNFAVRAECGATESANSNIVNTGTTSPAPSAVPTSTPIPTTTKLGDLNHDGKVNIFDLSILLSKWGTADAASDLNHNGTVDIFDLSILLSKWEG